MRPKTKRKYIYITKRNSFQHKIQIQTSFLTKEDNEKAKCYIICVAITQSSEGKPQKIQHTHSVSR